MAMATLRGRGSALGRRSLDHGLRGEQEFTRMRSDFWASLPESLIEEILGKLPFSSLVRFCSVSKRWRDLILSPGVFPRCTSRHSRLISFSWNRMIMNVLSTWSMEVWKSVPLDLAKAFIGGLVWPLRVQTVVISTGGLLCFHTFRVGQYIVYNPVSKWRKDIPQMPCREETTIFDQPYIHSTMNGIFSLQSLLLEGMVIDWDTGHFKLIVGSLFGGSRGTTHVYDSCVNSWNKTVMIPDSILKFLGNYLSYDSHDLVIESIASGANLFFYLKHIAGPEDLLLRYHVEEQAWNWLPLPRRAYDSYPWTLCNIIQCNGKLLLVTPTYMLQEDDTIHMSVQVLELRDSAAPVVELQEPWSTLWLPTNASPFSGIREEMSISSVHKELPIGTHVQCLGEGDVVFFIRTNIYTKKTSVRKWFHNVATNSYINSKWEDYQGDSYHKSPNFNIFKPSTTFLK